VLGGKKPPWEWSHTDRGTNHVRANDSGTNHVRVNLCLTLKLTGWLASLHLAPPMKRLILSHRTASPHALYDVLVLDGRRGKIMSNLVNSARELPVKNWQHRIVWFSRQLANEIFRLGFSPLFNYISCQRVACTCNTLTRIQTWLAQLFAVITPTSITDDLLSQRLCHDITWKGCRSMGWLRLVGSLKS